MSTARQQPTGPVSRVLPEGMKATTTESAARRFTKEMLSAGEDTGIPEKAHTNQRTAGRKKPTRTIVNFWLDVALLLLLVAYGAVAAIVYLVFPVGTAASEWTLWGFGYDQWCGFQFGLFCVFSFGILVHVMLHWTWVCSVLFRNVLNREGLPDNGIRTLYGVGLLIVLLHIVGGIVLLAEFTVHQPQ